MWKGWRSVGSTRRVNRIWSFWAAPVRLYTLLTVSWMRTWYVNKTYRNVIRLIYGRRWISRCMKRLDIGVRLDISPDKLRKDEIATRYTRSIPTYTYHVYWKYRIKYMARFGALKRMKQKDIRPVEIDYDFQTFKCFYVKTLIIRLAG